MAPKESKQNGGTVAKRNGNKEKDSETARLRETCGLTGHFVLRSGQISDFYFDKYLFEADPVLLTAVTGLTAPLIPESTEILAGLELGRRAAFHGLSLITWPPTGACPQGGQGVRYGQTGRRARNRWTEACGHGRRDHHGRPSGAVH